MNSWQQPVAAEPGWGTPHPHRVVLVDIDPDTSVTTVDCSGNVPVGTHMVLVDAHYEGNGLYNVSFFADAAATLKWTMMHGVAVGFSHSQFLIALDASYYFYYQASNAAVTDLEITMLLYWI